MKQGPMVEKNASQQFYLMILWMVSSSRLRRYESIEIPASVPALTLGEYEEIAMGRLKEVLPVVMEKDKMDEKIDSIWEGFHSVRSRYCPESGKVKLVERKWANP